MAEQEAEQSRSEKATPFKLSKARERGVVARGSDLGFFLALAAMTSFLWAQGPTTGVRLASAMRQALVASSRSPAGSSYLLDLIGHVGAAMARSVVLAPLLVFGFVLVGEIMQTGFVFTTEPLRLEFGRLNPSKVARRLFSTRILIETSKQLLKAATYATVAAWVIGAAWRIQAPAIVDANDLAATMFTTARRLLVLSLGLAAAFAVLDQLIVRQQFNKEMRMSRREVRRELRDREGDPRLKQKRRQLHKQFSRDAKSLKNVRNADLLITNPTHYAVGLRYEPATMTAPVVIAQGQSHTAARLRKAALQYGITVVEDAPLARALYLKARFERPIPERFFREVATLYISLRDRKRQRAER